MQLKPELTYHIRALAAEVANLELQTQARRRDLAVLLERHGLDAQQHAFVLQDDGQYPLGTVLDRVTGKPVVVAAGPAEAPTEPSVG